MIELPPQNLVERLIKSASEGTTTRGAFIRAILPVEVTVLSGSYVEEDGTGLDPLLFEKQGVLHLAAFTDDSRMGIYTQQAPYTGKVTMYRLLQQVPPGYGVVVNPGTSLHFELSWQGIQNILEDFSDPNNPVRPAP